jgi:hypothetical protein
VNAQAETLNLRIKLPMLQASTELKSYTDDVQLNGKISMVKLSKNQEIEMQIPSNGGILFVQ